VSENRVKVSGVSYDVADARLIEDVTFSARAGQFLGVIGPNGAGKSTLLGVVGGQLSPSRGHVELLGVRIAGVPSRELATMRSMLGANPPGDIPFAARTVVEAGRYPFRGLPDNSAEEDERLIERALDIADVAALESRTYRTLSSGEQARVMIARVLAQASPVALLDEPTASLDAANGEKALRALSHDPESDATVICVLHDLNQAAFHCDRLLLMHRGHLVRDGAPDEVLEADLLSEVYGQDMRVVAHPFRDCPLVLVA
jgi:iron complex transport system ATP-binding protein